MGTDALDHFEDEGEYDYEEIATSLAGSPYTTSSPYTGSPYTNEKVKLYPTAPSRGSTGRLGTGSLGGSRGGGEPLSSPGGSPPISSPPLSSPGGLGSRHENMNRITATAPAWCDRRSPSTAQQRPSVHRVGSQSPRGGPPGGVVRRSSAPNISQAEFSGRRGSFDSKGDVSLCIRLRPGEGEEVVDAPSRNTVRLKVPEGRKSEASDAMFGCDSAFSTDATQEQVYLDAVTPICEGVIRGYNGAVIAYGQTGSGKTYTMIGNQRSKGVAPRAVAEIFSALEKRSCWTVEVSVLEIYNERVRDLLAPGNNISHVEIHEICAKDGNISFRCPDATMWKAANPEEALSALNEGMRRRETAKTDMNHNSSRSHLIFTLATTQTDKEIGATLRGRLHLVDLAGSERLKRSMSSDRSSFRSSNSTGRTPRDQRREAGEINKSLSQLALVIQRLTSSGSSTLQYVPYRDSMLTRLLAESFGGSSKTCLIITCSTLIRDREESRCSLDFGRRAKLVQNKAEINLEVDHEPTAVLQAWVSKEILELQREKERMLQEREMLIADHNRMQEKLTKAESLTREAVSDVLSQHERRISEVCQLEDDKAALQNKLADSAQAAADLQEAHASEATELREVQLLLHRRLVECATEISQLKQEKEAAQRRHQEELQGMKTQAAEHERQLESRANQVAALRAELQRLAQEKAAVIAKLEQESSALRDRWLEDVSRLEQEKAAAAALGEVEKTALRLRLQQVLQDLQSRPQGGVDLEEASAAAIQAEQEGAHAVAESAERSAALRRRLEAATEGIVHLERLRSRRLEELEAETSELHNRWRGTLVESATASPEVGGSLVIDAAPGPVSASESAPALQSPPSAPALQSPPAAQVSFADPGPAVQAHVSTESIPVVTPWQPQQLSPVQAHDIELMNQAIRKVREEALNAGVAPSPSQQDVNELQLMKERMASVDVNMDACSTPQGPTRCFSLDLIENTTNAPGPPRFGTATPEGPHPQAEAPPAALLPRTAWTGKGMDGSLPLLSSSELVKDMESPAPEKLSSPI